jgi:hypothetical protein
MKSWELLRELFAPKGVKHIASRLGLSRWLVHKWTHPAGGTSSGARNPLDVLSLLMESTDAPRLAQWVCQQCGGYFVPNPQVKAHAPEPLLAAHSRVVREFGELIALVCEAAGDNRITVPEAQRIRQRWEALKTLTEDFAQCCERGDFLALQAAMLRQASPQSPARLAPPENDASARAQA